MTSLSKKTKRQNTEDEDTCQDMTKEFHRLPEAVLTGESMKPSSKKEKRQKTDNGDSSQDMTKECHRLPEELSTGESRMRSSYMFKHSQKTDYGDFEGDAMVKVQNKTGGSIGGHGLKPSSDKTENIEETGSQIKDKDAVTINQVALELFVKDFTFRKNEENCSSPIRVCQSDTAFIATASSTKHLELNSQPGESAHFTEFKEEKKKRKRKRKRKKKQKADQQLGHGDLEDLNLASKTEQPAASLVNYENFETGLQREQMEVSQVVLESCGVNNITSLFDRWIRKETYSDVVSLHQGDETSTMAALCTEKSEPVPRHCETGHSLVLEGEVKIKRKRKKKKTSNANRPLGIEVSEHLNAGTFSDSLHKGRLSACHWMETSEKRVDEDAPKVQFSLENIKELYVILDLNGVLIKRWDKNPSLSGVSKLKKKWIQLRPGCIEFLCKAFSKFKLGIWSTMLPENVEDTCKFLENQARQHLPFFMLWSKASCYQNGGVFRPNKSNYILADFKPLSYIWEFFKPYLGPHNTVLVDDSPYKACMNNPHNCIFPEAFEGCRDDNYLNATLWPYLEKMSMVENVQAYIADNPFGQQPIVAGHELYDHVQEVMDASDYPFHLSEDVIGKL